MSSSRPLSLLVAMTVACVGFTGRTVQAVVIGPDTFGYRATNDFLSGFTDISGSGTSVPALDNQDDAVSPAINLPFNFKFYGRDYNSIQFNTNGLISFGIGQTQYQNVQLVSADLGFSVIAPFWDDWRHPRGDCRALRWAARSKSRRAASKRLRAS